MYFDHSLLKKNTIFQVHIKPWGTVKRKKGDDILKSLLL
jgi:hypothetical protein